MSVVVRLHARISFWDALKLRIAGASVIQKILEKHAGDILTATPEDAA